MTINIRGNNIGLRPFQTDDIEKIASWMNDDEVTHFMFYGRRPMSVWQVEKMFRDYLESERNAIFMAVDMASRSTIGFAGFFEMDHIARTGEPRIMIGEKRFRGQYCGMETFALLVHYGFDRLNLNMIYGGVTRPDNRGAEKFYELMGCKIGGVRRQMAYRNGIYYDAIMYDLLRSEYYPGIMELYKKNFGVVTT